MNGPNGFVVFNPDRAVADWAKTAIINIKNDIQPIDDKSKSVRHGGTWFPGIDALGNAQDGSIDGIHLKGAWRALVPDLPLHPAQVSIIYRGYPRQDDDESDASHRYRITRFAAHVDGVLPVGPKRRRYAREYHAYILAIPLNLAPVAPTIVWRGSHRIMQAAFTNVIGRENPKFVDITDAYHAARRVVFDTCEPVPLSMKTGQSALIHRLALHGTAPWPDDTAGPKEGRMIAFFRPELSELDAAQAWLTAP